MIHEGVPHRVALPWCLKSGVLKAQKFGGCQGGSRFARLKGIQSIQINDSWYVVCHLLLFLSRVNWVRRPA